MDIKIFKETFGTLSCRAQNCLLHHRPLPQITTLDDLYHARYRLTEIKNLGKITYRELMDFLEIKGYKKIIGVKEIDEIKICGFNVPQLIEIINFAKSKNFEPTKL